MKKIIQLLFLLAFCVSFAQEKHFCGEFKHQDQPLEEIKQNFQWEINSRGETEKIPNYKWFDRFGNKYADLRLQKEDKSKSTANRLVPTFTYSTPDCQSDEGLFNLYFVEIQEEINGGFNDPVNNAMIVVICQVFNDLDVLINQAQPVCITGNNQMNPVNIRVESINEPGSGVLGSASSYYDNEGETTGTIHGEVWQAINTDYNDPNEWDGIVRINLGYSNWYTGLDGMPGSSIDLYTVVLHEVLHALGFASLIAQDGSSKHQFTSGNPVLTNYSPYDQFLHLNDNTPLINNGNYNTPNPVDDLTSGCQNSSSNVEFRGVFNTPLSPIHAPEIWSNGSSLSHFETNCDSYGNFADYVMNPSIAVGQARTLTQEEINTLADLGYALSGVFGTSPTLANGSDNPNYLDSTDFTNPSSTIFAATDDFGPCCTETNFEIEFCDENTLEISINDLICNDINPNNAMVTMVEDMETNEILQVNETTFTFTFTPSQTGTQVLRYLLDDGNGNQSNYAYVYITVFPCAGFGCVNTDTCNLICNPGLDDGGSCDNVNNPFSCTRQLHHDSNNTYNCSDLLSSISGWYPFAGTPDSYLGGCSLQNSNPLQPVNGEEYIFLWDGFGNSEGLMTAIQVEPNQRYIISYHQAEGKGNGLNHQLNVFITHLNDITWFPNAGPVQDSSSIPDNQELIFSDNFNNTNWAQNIICFSPNESYNILYFRPVSLNNQTSGVYLDQVELIEDHLQDIQQDFTVGCQDLLVIGEPLCGVTNMVYSWWDVTDHDNEIQLTDGEEVLDDSVSLPDGSNGSELQISPTSSFTYELRRTFVEGDYPIANVVGCDDNNSVQVQVNVVTDITIEKELLNSPDIPNGSAATFQITVTNNTGFPLTDFVVTDVLDAGFNGDSVALLPNANVSITSLGNPIDFTISNLPHGASEQITFDVTVNGTSGETIQNCASFTYLGCTHEDCTDVTISPCATNIEDIIYQNTDCEFQFEALTSGSNTIDWEWIINNEIITDQSSMGSYIFPENGTYTVCARAFCDDTTFDDFCIEVVVDCIEECIPATLDFHLEDANGNETTQFCLGDQVNVIVNAENETQYNILFRRLGQSGNFAHDIVNGTIENIMDLELFTTNYTPSFQFSANTYVLSIAVENECTPGNIWSNLVPLQFDIIDCCIPSTVDAQLVDSEGNTASEFCHGDSINITINAEHETQYHVFVRYPNQPGFLATTGWLEGPAMDITNLEPLLMTQSGLDFQFQINTEYEINVVTQNENYCINDWSFIMLPISIIDCSIDIDPSCPIMGCETTPDTGFESSLGWSAAWSSGADYIENPSSLNHYWRFWVHHNDRLLDASAIITDCPLDLIAGEEYVLEYDALYYGTHISNEYEAIRISLSDGDIPNDTFVSPSSLNTLPIDEFTPNYINISPNQPVPISDFTHRGPIVFTAPNDTSLRYVLVHGINDSVIGTVWYGIDNISITPVDNEAPCYQISIEKEVVGNYIIYDDSEATFEITVTNINTDENLNDVVITDVLPSNLDISTLQVFNNPNVTYEIDENMITFTILHLDDGDSEVIGFEVLAYGDPGEIIQNCASFEYLNSTYQDCAEVEIFTCPTEFITESYLIDDTDNDTSEFCYGDSIGLYVNAGNGIQFGIGIQYEGASSYIVNSNTIFSPTINISDLESFFNSLDPDFQVENNTNYEVVVYTYVECLGWQYETLTLNIIECTEPCLPEIPQNLSCTEPSIELGGWPLTWDPVVDAISYELLVISNNESCCSNESDSFPYTYTGITTNNYLLPSDFMQNGENFSCFSWQVRAICSSGEISEYSNLECYNKGLACTSINCDGTPVNLSCSIDTLSGTTVDNLTWLPALGATGGYQVELYFNDPNNGCCQNGGYPSATIFETENTVFSFNNPNDRCYSWRIRLVCDTGAGTWSESICRTDCDGGTMCEIINRVALMELYNATDGPNWTNSTNWGNPNASLDQWHGITTNAEGCVTKIELGSNGLSGTIPSSIGNFENLTVLYLDRNNLTGSIPSEIGNLTNLVWFHLNVNNLTGTIPSEIGNLTQLRDISLQSNQLSGIIPPEIGNIPNLKWLHLFYNNLTGNIPPDLGNLNNLSSLTIHGNQLTGTLPTELGNLTSIINLYVHWNNLDGNIPSSLGNLTTLKNLGLMGNNFDGDLHQVAWDNLPNLIKLYLNNNNFSGTLPGSFAGLNALTFLDLRNNDFEGCIPEVYYGSHLCNIDTRLGGNPSLTDADNFSEFCAGNSECVPCNVTNQAALIALYNTTNGDNWINNTNWGDVTVPLDQWHGVSTNAQGCVTWINLENNNLVGTLPDELGNLTELGGFYITNNQVSGPLPASMGNLTKLVYLYADNNNLNGNLSALGGCTSLIHMFLGNNDFTDALPASFGVLSNLQWIRLNNNALIGSIPPEWGGMTALKNFYLHDNMIDGSIPSELGALTELVYVYWANNQIEGPLPSSIGNWTNMLHLFLHQNNIWGTIPSELGQLTTNLQWIKLHDNQLTGSIPGELGNLSPSVGGAIINLELYNNDLSGCYDTNLANLCGNVNTQFGGNPSLPSFSSFCNDGTGSCGQARTSISMSVKDPIAIKISPNPNNGSFSVSLNKTLDSYATEIYNITGIQIFNETQYKSNNMEVDISKYPSGLYFVKVITEEGTFMEKVIVK